MVLFVIGHTYHYECEKLCRVFFPNDEVKIQYELPSVLPEFCAVTFAEEGIESRSVSAELYYKGGSFTENDNVLHSEPDYDKECEYHMALCLFKVLEVATGYIPEWGLLTGVRPSKLMNLLISESGVEAAKKSFGERLFVSKEKTALAIDVACAEKKIIDVSQPMDFSLYVSIPFCPSRCSYCSFVSHSITNSNAAKLLEPYLIKLCEELEETAKIAKSVGLRLVSVYFGGGTPSILSAEQLLLLIDKIRSCFDMSAVCEYTIEAGRPDTVTAPKMQAMAQNGVTRVSINPQTFDDEILKAVGRKHTARQALYAFALAREAGIKSINMDLIAGLPGDTPEGFEKSLKTVLSLKPENVTVHSLALKRASTLALAGTEIEQGNTAKQMLSISSRLLGDNGYIPYYMYRQSRCVGNLENVGWCKPGFECAYNVYMMEEIHTVLAVGAGAVTKLKQPGGMHIERIFNYKYPYEYNSRFSEMLSRKVGITKFYDSYK